MDEQVACAKVKVVAAECKIKARHERLVVTVIDNEKLDLHVVAGKVLNAQQMRYAVGTHDGGSAEHICVLVSHNVNVQLFWKRVAANCSQQEPTRDDAMIIAFKQAKKSIVDSVVLSKVLPQVNENGAPRNVCKCVGLLLAQKCECVGHTYPAERGHVPFQAFCNGQHRRGVHFEAPFLFAFFFFLLFRNPKRRKKRGGDNIQMAGACNVFLASIVETGSRINL